MASVAVTLASGWLVVVILATTSLLPWARRWVDLRVHYGLAYTIVPICMLHSGP